MPIEPEVVVRVPGRADVRGTEVGIEDVARFVAWLRAPAANVVVLAGRARAAGAGDGEPLPGRGVRLLRPPCPLRRPGWPPSLWRGGGSAGAPTSPFLHHVTKGRPIPTRPVKLRGPSAPPRHARARADCGHLGRLRAPAGPFLDSLCWPRPGCASARRSGCATAISSPTAGRCTSSPGPTTPTGPGPSAAQPAGGPGPDPAGAAVLGVHAHRVRRPDSDYVFVNFSGGRVGRPLTLCRPCTSWSAGSRRPHRGRLHRLTCCATRTPPTWSARRADRGGGQAADPPFFDHDQPDLRAPRRRRCTSCSCRGRRPGLPAGGRTIEPGCRPPPGPKLPVSWCCAGAQTGLDGEWAVGPLGSRASRRPCTKRASGLVSFDAVAQSWLERPVKRWSRFRLATGCSFMTIAAGALALAVSPGFLAEAIPRSTSRPASHARC